MMPDYYALLQVAPTADFEVIAAAYRGLAKKYHPDRNPGVGAAGQIMAALNKAYEVLSNPESRAAYDRARCAGAKANVVGPSSADADPAPQARRPVPDRPQAAAPTRQPSRPLSKRGSTARAAPSASRTAAPRPPVPVPARRFGYPVYCLIAILALVLLGLGLGISELITHKSPTAAALADQPTDNPPTGAAAASQPKSDKPPPFNPNMKFAKVKGGTFWMGETGKQKQVSVGDFEMGVCEVTQGLWKHVMSGANPSAFSRNGSSAREVKDVSDADLDLFPVERVSWDMIQVFLTNLNAMEKTKGSGYLYRLPSSAEWEFACRGGATSQEECRFHYYFDKPTEKLTSADANFSTLGETTGPVARSIGRPVKVGSYQTNKLGLYDMHGNVSEWTDSSDGPFRVCRDGSWLLPGRNCRAAYIFGGWPNSQHNTLGFRLARVPVANGKAETDPLRVDPTNQEKEWSEHVLLGVNPASPGAACKRWIKRPQVSAFGANGGQAKALEWALELLNETLLATPIGKIDLGKPYDDEADLKVHFAPEQEFANLAKKYDFRFEKGNRTFFWVWWNAKRELTKGVALVAADAEGDELKRFTLRELTRCLGLIGESAEFENSIFYRKGQLGTSSTSLSRRDKKLIIFLYNKVPLGAKLPALQAQYKSW